MLFSGVELRRRQLPRHLLVFGMFLQDRRTIPTWATYKSRLASSRNHATPLISTPVQQMFPEIRPDSLKRRPRAQEQPKIFHSTTPRLPNLNIVPKFCDQRPSARVDRGSHCVFIIVTFRSPVA